MYMTKFFQEMRAYTVHASDQHFKAKFIYNVHVVQKIESVQQMNGAPHVASAVCNNNR
jgi:hypothetical protein